MLCGGAGWARQDSGRPDPASVFRGLAESLKQQQTAPAAEPSAEPTAAEEAALERALVAWGSDEYEVREAASQAMRESLEVSDDALSRAIRERPLSAEQRERAQEAMRDRFFAGPRPALGVRMRGLLDAAGVAIEGVLEPFPAHKVLKAQDIVLSIDDVVLEPGPDTSRLSQAILSRNPGDRVRLVVVREGQRLELETALGRLDQLDSSGAPPNLSQNLTAAWVIRAARLGVLAPTEPVVRVLAPRDVWIRDRRSAANPGAGDGIVPGGLRSGAGSADAYAASVTQRIRVNDAIQNAAPKGQRAAGDVVAQMLQLRAFMNRMDLRIAEARAEQSRPGVAPQRVAELETEIRQIESAKAEVLQQVDRLERLGR